MYPAVLKVLDTVLQSLNQMRTLSLVDDSPDLASAVDARISFTKAQRYVQSSRDTYHYSKCSCRCLYLARCYSPVKKYAEALTLIQHANIHIRETRSFISLSDTDVISSAKPSYFPLSDAAVQDLETELSSDAHQFKRDWFAYNGGSIDADPKAYKKPVFYNIAFNYVNPDVDRLKVRAGQQPAVASPAAAPVQKQSTTTAVEEERAATPEPSQRPPARGGLSNLLGGWWGKN